MLTIEDESRLDPAVVASLYERHAAELIRFLTGVLRDGQAARDVAQAAFEKLAAKGHESRAETRKAWLFRVAYHEAMRLKRRQAVHAKAVERLGGGAEPFAEASAEASAIREEDLAAVRAALQALPEPQRQVVRMRIYEDKKFVEIASELDIPLGTALARMRAALTKLRRSLGNLAKE